MVNLRLKAQLKLMKSISNKRASLLLLAGAFNGAAWAVNDLPGGPSVRQLNLHPAVTRIAVEQAMSRLYGGIHYRFDNDGGLALGRVVGRHAVARERSGGLSAWRVARTERKP